METALSVPEVVDYIFSQATPSAQAAAAQTCQRWSDHALRCLWRNMNSITPFFKIPGPLSFQRTDDDGHTRWEPTIDLSDTASHRFDRYSAYVLSIDYNEYRSFWDYDTIPPYHLLEQVLRQSSMESLFPNLQEIVWQSTGSTTLRYIRLFLVPSVTSLKVNCYRAAHDMENGCMEALELLAPKQISLSRLGLTMWTYGQDFLNRLPAVLDNQPRLAWVSLPPYSATLQVVKALGRLPVLEEYLASFYEEYQNPVELLGRRVDWEKGAFPALRRLTLYTSLADASFVMAKPHQPRLQHLTLANRDAFHNSDVYALCSSLSTNQFNITTLYLFIYYDSKNEAARGPMPFDLFRPLLQCRGLAEFRLRSHLVIAYDDKDIASMANAWPNMRFLTLCPDPDLQVNLNDGQPFLSIGIFGCSFTNLRELGIYVNTLDAGLIPDAHHARLAVLDLGTSVAPLGDEEHIISAASEYLAKVVEPRGKVKAGRSVSYVRFLLREETYEINIRAGLWSTVAKLVKEIHGGVEGSEGSDTD